MRSGLYTTLGLILVTAIWGATFVVVQDAVRGYSAYAFLLFRFALAAAVLLPFSLRSITRGTIVLGLPTGIALGLGMLLQTIGLRTTTATNSGFITGVCVVIAPLLARYWFGTPVGRRLWLAIALSGLGLVLIAGGAPGDLGLGDLLTLGAAAMFAVQIALLSRYAARHSSTALAAVQVVVSGLIVAGPALRSTPVLPPSPDVWTAVMVTGLGASAFGFWMQTYAQQRIPAARAAVALSLEPVFAALTGYLVAGDRLGAVQWGGAGLLLAALLLAEVAPFVRLSRMSRRAVPSAAGGQT